MGVPAPSVSPKLINQHMLMLAASRYLVDRCSRAAVAVKFRGDTKRSTRWELPCTSMFLLLLSLVTSVCCRKLMLLQLSVAGHVVTRIALAVLFFCELRQL